MGRKSRQKRESRLAAAPGVMVANRRWRDMPETERRLVESMPELSKRILALVKPFEAGMPSKTHSMLMVWMAVHAWNMSVMSSDEMPDIDGLSDELRGEITPIIGLLKNLKGELFPDDNRLVESYKVDETARGPVLYVRYKLSMPSATTRGMEMLLDEHMQDGEHDSPRQ